MNRRVALTVAFLLTLAPGAQAQDEESVAADQTGWSAVMLPQTEAIGALAKGVAVGPDLIVAVGQRACERTKDGDLGRCWGQPWISTDGLTWEAVEARTSGLDLGLFQYTTSGPETGLGGVAYGPGGFVAFGWAAPVSASDAELGSDPAGLEPTLWRSDDGTAWSRVQTPESFATEGLMLRGPLLHVIAGTDDGYFLGGTIYGTPAPRAAIWSSPDGLTWTLAGPDKDFKVGAYIDTMEVPVAGGISSIAIEPSSDGSVSRVIAVGSACPRAKAGAGPNGRGWKKWDWTTGECRARIWRSDGGVAWEAGAFTDASGARIDGYRANTVATMGDGSVVGVYPRTVLYSEDDAAWAVAQGGKQGRQMALAANEAAFYAFVPKCEAAKCRRKTLASWSSGDGADWALDASQPAMPSGVEDFLEVDAAAFGDRIVVTAGYWTSPSSDLASMALLSPALEAPVVPETETSPAS